MRPHAYMYSKKLDERDLEKPLPAHSKKSRDPPPNHEFVYRWYRGPKQEPCAFEGCPRRTSFSPHDWSMHALGGGGCSLQCISTQSSLYKATFCNSKCFVNAWKSQYTVTPTASAQTPPPQSRGFVHRRPSVGSEHIDDDRSIGSVGSTSSFPKFVPQNSHVPSTENSENDPAVDEESSSPQTPTGNNNPYQQKNFQSYKKGFHDMGGDIDLSGQLNDEWIEISQDHIYIPNDQDVGRKLKLEAAALSMETGEVLMQRVVKTDLVLNRAPDPVKRNLVTVKGVGSGGGGTRFRIVTYNVLAEIYATQQQYPYCDFWALSWDYRFQNILREIVEVGPDVICLQEVQADHYENHVYGALSDAGFEGVYKQKTRDSMGLTGKVDGCALFWRRTKFHLVESYSIEFNELSQRQATQVLGLNPRSEDGSSYLNRLCRDNVAQLVVLECVNPSMPSRSNREPINQLCVANTHLYSHKDYPDVKLWQTWQLLQELETFVMSRGTNLPLMICGDFNSTPDTAVYDLLSRQAVHPGHPDVNMANGEDNMANILPEIMNMTHSFSLGSVYNSVIGEEPRYTNYTTNFKGTLDYMWYSAQNLRPLSAAPIPEESVLTLHGEALPSTQFSSDHVMLISDMQIGSGSRPQ